MEQTEHDELRSLVRMAANGWIEHTETDEKVLVSLQDEMLVWAASYLSLKGQKAAGAMLLKLVPDDSIRAALIKAN